MAKCEGKVTHYAEGTANVTVYFPNGQICCRFCEFLHESKGLGRGYCNLQRRKIIPLDYIDGLDIGCPLKFEKGELDSGKN